MHRNVVLYASPPPHFSISFTQLRQANRISIFIRPSIHSIIVICFLYITTTKLTQQNFSLMPVFVCVYVCLCACYVYNPSLQYEQNTKIRSALCIGTLKAHTARLLQNFQNLAEFVENGREKSLRISQLFYKINPRVESNVL